MAVITIAGGSGLIGMTLSELLAKNGHTVNILTRKTKKSGDPKINYCEWSPKDKKIDENIIRNSEVIINLAGANIAEGRWTDERKKLIIDSRVMTNEFLSHCVNTIPNNINKYISSSAIGYYGDRPGEKMFESSSPGEGFLSEVCVKWEDSVKIEKPDVQVYYMRTGVVLAKEGGAFPKLKMGLPFAVPYFGDGQQMMSWIHIDDICEMYKYLIESSPQAGAYNGSAPEPVSSKEMAKAISKIGSGLGLTVPVPEFALKAAMGEMSQTVLESVDASVDKIQKEGFKFTFPNLKGALKELFDK